MIRQGNFIQAFNCHKSRCGRGVFAWVFLPILADSIAYLWDWKSKNCVKNGKLDSPIYLISVSLSVFPLFCQLSAFSLSFSRSSGFLISTMCGVIMITISASSTAFFGVLEESADKRNVAQKSEVCFLPVSVSYG